MKGNGWRRASGVWLWCLVAACNAQELPPPPPPGGGAGGTSGSGGAGGLGGAGGDAPGGQDGNSDCMNGSYVCVTSCTTDLTTFISGLCDQANPPSCPAGSFLLDSCPANACARSAAYYCCDQTTGSLAYPVCGSDGLRACPTGALALPPSNQPTCIPAGLNVASCADLDGQPCDLIAQRCQSGDDECTCEHGGAGLIWFCSSLGSP